MAGRVQCAETAGQLPTTPRGWRSARSPARRPCARSPTTRSIRSSFWICTRRRRLGQAAQFELLASLIEKERLGQRDTFDFVCLIAGSTARLGYEIGGRSPLMHQMVLHLDRQLEYLLNAPQGRARRERRSTWCWPAPTARRPSPPRRAAPAWRWPGESVAQTVDRALLASGAGRVTRYLYPFLYLDTSGFRDPEPLRLAAGQRRARRTPRWPASTPPADTAPPTTAGGNASATAFTPRARAT